MPRIYLTSDWGELIRYLAYGGGIKLSEDSYEISVSGISFYSGIIEAFSPLQAMALSMLLLFLVSAFLGLLIFAFQILMGRGTGVVAAGFLTFLSYFCCYVGWIMFEGKLLYISPVNWICMGYLDINGTGIGPDILYAVAVLTAGIIFFSGSGTCMKYPGYFPSMIEITRSIPSGTFGARFRFSMYDFPRPSSCENPAFVFSVRKAPHRAYPCLWLLCFSLFSS